MQRSPSARQRALILVASLISLSFQPRPTLAQCTPQWTLGDAPAGVNGEVTCSTIWDPDGPGPLPERLVIGGGFGSINGMMALRVAMFDGTQWQPLGAGIPGYGELWALTVFNGDLIAAGNFYPGPGAAFRWDGAAWQPLGPAVPLFPFALTTHAGALYIAGDRSGATAVSPILRWDGQAWQPVATGLNGLVLSLLSHNGDLYAGGGFSALNGAPLKYIARWDGSQWHDVAGGMDSWVNVLSEFDGDVVAGGNFSHAGTLSSYAIARWNGQAWSAFGNTFVPPPLSISAFQNRLVVAGSNAPPRSWDGATWQVLTSGPYNVWTTKVFQGRLFMGGNFFGSSPGPADRSVAFWDGANWAPPSSGFNSWPTTLAEYRGEVIAGGDFRHAGLGTAIGCARWDGSQWNALSPGLSGQVTRLLRFGNDLIISGSDLFAGPTQVRVARWDGQALQPVGDGLPGGYDPVTLGVFRGALVAGRYASPSSATVNQYDGAAWQPMASVTASSLQSPATIVALCESDDGLIVAGQFGTAGTVSTPNIARWDGAAWHALGAGLPQRVGAVVNFNGQLFAAPSTYAPNSTHFAYRFDGTAWIPIDDGLNSYIRSFLIDGNDLLATTSGDGNNHSAIVRWDGTRWQPLGTPGYGSATALIRHNQELFATGAFTIGDRASYWMRFACPCYPNCDNSTAAPILSASDFGCFLNQFASGNSYANCDGSSASPVLNINDFQCFLNSFASGCP